MVTDAKLFFDDAQAVTTSKLSANVIDIGDISDVAKGSPVYVNIYVDTAFSSDTEQVTIDLVASTGAAMTAGDKVMELVPATAASSLTSAGLLKRVALPEGMSGNYIGVYYTATTAVASGKFTTFLSIGSADD